ncbi:conserved hypothetical protein [Ricinus communis]|uniref:Replication protein A 70 kDa DNA-binding subunit B/D first OB fold domain-containing protein n=1 Tax=Ricinus communis TaxID=3988 RepID=B9SPV0_RICCO|nr:conserved hypothetical protein [Ricinus communis]
MARMWETQNLKNNGDVLSLEMILIDEQEILILAIVRKNLINRFKSLLQGAIYIIKNPKVSETFGDYRPVKNNLRVYFLLIITLEEVQDSTTKIPRHGFEFANLETIDGRVDQDSPYLLC